MLMMHSQIRGSKQIFPFGRHANDTGSTTVVSIFSPDMLGRYTADLQMPETSHLQGFAH